jgi:predicted RNA-binding Zn-ribbon protein involved in translation (DUF1610 family)
MPKKLTNEQFIERATKLHNGTYTYGKTKYINNTTKVIVNCKEHGDFETIPNNHININKPTGCRKCADNKNGENKRISVDDFIKKSNAVHDSKYLYSKVIYVNCDTKVIITCKSCDGDFEQTPDKHIYAKHGCPKCGITKNANSRKKSVDEFIMKSNIIHNNKYNYNKVIYVNSHTKVIINCIEHGDFEQTPKEHRKSGCQKCGHLRIGDSKRSNVNVFIEKAREVHGDTYNYDAFEYKGNNIKGEISCKSHGAFMQTASDHINSKSGCPECGKEKGILARRLERMEFIERCNKAHNNEYDYSKTIFIDTKTDVTVNCKLHGDFMTNPNSHMNSTGCPKCGNIKKAESKRYTKDEFVAMANEIHNHKYNYGKSDYIDGMTKIIIICANHGDYSQYPVKHIHRKSGCPKCLMCPSCQLWRTYGKLCSFCIPKDKNKLYQKTKEMAVVKFLKDSLPDNDFIHNKSVGSDCTGGHLFPDILFDCETYFLIVEVDENRHRGADYKCDKARMYDIISKLGLPCIFIRYNPDSKQSDKNVLLNKIKEYLTLSDKIWDDYGFKAEYLFY